MRLSKILIILNFFLSTLLAGYWYLQGVTDPPEPKAVPMVVDVELPEVSSPPDVTRMSETVARPVLWPNRRPVEVETQGGQEAPADVVVLGVVASGVRDVVILKSGDDIIRLGEGDEASGWRVQRIEPARLVLTDARGHMRELIMNADSGRIEWRPVP